MLARKVRDFFGSEAMRQTRHVLRRDPSQMLPIIDRCVAAMDAGHSEQAIEALRRYIAAVGEAIMSLNAPRGRADMTGGTSR